MDKFPNNNGKKKNAAKQVGNFRYIYFVCKQKEKIKNISLLGTNCLSERKRSELWNVKPKQLIFVIKNFFILSVLDQGVKFTKQTFPYCLFCPFMS